MKRFYLQIAAPVVGNSIKCKMEDFAVFWIEMILCVLAHIHARTPAHIHANTMNPNSIPSKARDFFESAQPPFQ